MNGIINFKFPTENNTSSTSTPSFIESVISKIVALAKFIFNYLFNTKTPSQLESLGAAYQNPSNRVAKDELVLDFARQHSEEPTVFANKQSIAIVPNDNPGEATYYEAHETTPIGNQKVILCSAPRTVVGVWSADSLKETPQASPLFWGMLLQQEGPTTIVQLNNPEEPSKSKTPLLDYTDEGYRHALNRDNSITKVYIETKLQKSSQRGVTVKTISIHEESSGTLLKEVTVIQVDRWDDGRATSPDFLADLIRNLDGGRPPNTPSSLIAHCNQGVGRTGTFALAYQTWNILKKQNMAHLSLDGKRNLIRSTLLKQLQELRDPQKGRASSMVQTGEQYVCAYETVCKLLGIEEPYSSNN